MNKLKTWWQNEHIKSIVIALAFVTFILLFLYFSKYINKDLLDFGLIGGGFIGLIGIFFPQFLFKCTHIASEEKYNKKDSWKYRLGGFLIVIMAFAFYIYDNFVRI